MKIDRQNIASLIDHGLLRPDVTKDDIWRLCEEAMDHGFCSVCVNPSYISTAKEILQQSRVRISTVIGFPSGMTLRKVKIYESLEAVMEGADELDIVINIGLAKSDIWNEVEKEISDIIRATPAAVHKVIIETCYLTDDEKRKATSVVLNTGAAFIKTSTGFGPSGADARDISLIRSVARGRIGIKAAGGIRTLKDVLLLVDAGATRIGTSSGADIMKEIG